MKKKKRYAVFIASAVALSLLASASVAAEQAGATGIVASIDKAPVIADGNVTGKPFDYVITLDGSLDPQVLGRGIAAGKTIKVFLPDQFELSNLNLDYPVATPPATNCVPGDLQCTTAVILRGWPQDPFFPPANFHTLSIDHAHNALVLTAEDNIGLIPGTGAGRPPYIKQVHLILHGLTNPLPGKYTVRVEAETGPDGTVESGEGQLIVLAKTKPSINPTSVFVDPLVNGACSGPSGNPPNPDNPVYQTTGVGEDAPFVWSFLLWGKNDKPLDNVWLHKVGKSHWLMLRNESRRFRFRDIVGRLRIDAPKGARGYGVRLNNDDPSFDCPTLLPAAPVIGSTAGIGPQPVGRLDLQFAAGDKPGIYKTTLWLSHGNNVEMVVRAIAP